MNTKKEGIVGKIKAIELVKAWSKGVIGYTSAKNMVTDAFAAREIDHVHTGKGDHSRWYVSVVNLRRWYDGKFPTEEAK